MSEKIHVKCYKCKTVYELEYEFRGQLVECAVCNAVFEVPQLGGKRKIKTAETDNSVENGTQAAPEGEDPNLKTCVGIESAPVESKTTKLSTKTIRLPRARCGMLPEVDDKFGAEQACNTTYHRKEHHAPKDALDDFAKTQAKPVKKTQKAASKWWCFWKKNK